VRIAAVSITGECRVYKLQDVNEGLEGHPREPQEHLKAATERQALEVRGLQSRRAWTSWLRK